MKNKLISRSLVLLAGVSGTVRERYTQVSDEEIERRWKVQQPVSFCYRFDTVCLCEVQLGGDNIGVVTDPNSALTQVWNEFYNCVGRACGNTDRLVELATLLKAHSEISTNSNNVVTPSTTNVSVIHSFCGSPKSADDVVVRPPNIAKNKGSGKRLKSIREKVAEKATKAKRLCRTCKQFAHHDSRNCPEA
nr:protein FAR1-RELATED SEQUENCE 5-like [Ipomoea batatas]